MKNIKQDPAEKYVKEHKKRKWWQRCVSVLAAVAVFCTTYAMILPAITWERSLVCEIPEHHHGDSCYEMVMVPGEKELVCPETEHIHGQECYAITDNLICDLAESEGHTHSEACFDEAGELICDLEESEGHVHSESCFEKTLACQLPTHTHSDSCYIESELHEEKVLVCQLDEHEHTSACFDAPPEEEEGYYCGMIEHTHSEEQYCYFSDGTLCCTIPEHIHTEECKKTAEEIVSIESRTGDGRTVTVTGHIPSDSIVRVTKVSESTLNGILEEIGADNSVFAYDISIIDRDGTEWQPDEMGVKVRISGLDLPQNEKIEVVHIPEAGTPEPVSVQQYDSEINFTADGFSIFVGYTVDFHYGGLSFSIDGEGSVLLSEIFTQLNIDKHVSDVEYVAFSNEDLVRVEQQTEDWMLTSLAPFSTEEELSIFFTDGSDILIEITDAQIGSRTYVLFWLDVDSSIPTIQQFEYTLQYAGLDFNYDINTKNATVLTSQAPTALNKTVTIAAGSRIPIYVLEGTNYLKINETPIPDVHTFYQLGGTPMVEGHNVMIGNESTPGIFTWIYGDGGAICYKHTSDEYLGKITIKKEVTGNAPSGQSYQFSVVRHNGSYQWVEQIVTLQAGQTSVEIPYTHTTDFGVPPQIWIAELNTPSSATATYMVNGSASTAQVRTLDGRFLQDVCGTNDKLHEYEALKWILLDTVSSQPDISVVCTNAFPSNKNLTVSKAVSGVTDNTTQFSFELSAMDVSSYPYSYISFAGKTLPSGVTLKTGNSNVLTFNLRNGQSVNINNLIPQDSLVTLTETSHSNYSVSMCKSSTTQNSDTWQFLLDNDSSIAVTNTAIPVGSLTVKKTVTGGTSSDSFPMQLTIVDTSGKIDFRDAAFYGRASIPTGVTRTAVSKNSITFSFSLAHSNQITIGNLIPNGAQVTISETVSGNYEPSIKVGSSSQNGDSRTFTVSGTGTTNVEVENHLNTGPSLTVSKSVVGTPTAQAFPFELTVLNSDDTVPDLSTKQSSFQSGVTLKSGTTNVLCFNLANGNSVAIADILPNNAKLTLTETNHPGYTVTMQTNSMHYSGDSNTFVLSSDMTVSVTNTTGTELPSTGGIGVYPIYALGALLIVGSIMYGYILRRRRERRAE